MIKIKSNITKKNKNQSSYNTSILVNKENKENKANKANKVNKINKANKVNKVTKTRKNKVKVLTVKYVLPESEIETKEGDFYDTDDYNTIIDYDCDVYGLDETSSRICLLKLRKNVIPQDICINTFTALEKQAQKLNDNRGAAAGKIKKSQLPNHVKELIQKEKFRAYYKDASGIQRKSHISNRVRSNIIGYYDKPDRNILNKYGTAPKCRQTAFTRDEVEKWNSACDIFINGDTMFKKLMPREHTIQLRQCRKTPEYQIKDTAFSTVTVNYNYRSALHKDAGDLDDGFGNLMVLEKNKCVSSNEDVYGYTGGYLGFPKYGIAVDVRQGDFLAMNVHEWHANCKMICNCVKKEKCRNKDHFGRLSLVCYLRKNMIQCANMIN